MNNGDRVLADISRVVPTKTGCPPLKVQQDRTLECHEIRIHWTETVATSRLGLGLILRVCKTIRAVLFYLGRNGILVEL